MSYGTRTRGVIERFSTALFYDERRRYSVLRRPDDCGTFRTSTLMSKRTIRIADEGGGGVGGT